MKNLNDIISLSTCCCSGKFDDGYKMIEWISGLGFKKIELSHGISLNLVPGIIRALEDNIVTVSSVHNFCPLPIGINVPAPNLFKPSSPNKSELLLWRKYTEATIKFASKVKSQNIVMHSGSAWFFFNSPLNKFEKWIKSKNLDILEYESDLDFILIRDKTINKIKKASHKRYISLRKSLQSITDFAKSNSVFLGLENREGFAELPLDQDHSDFIKSFQFDSSIRYWHDTGHAEIKALYGLLDHEKRLEELKDYTLGFHLHDVDSNGRDHQEIGTGIIDFKMISRYIDVASHEIVLELNPSLSETSILNSRDYILNCIR